MRVLIVEDEERLAQLIQRALADQGIAGDIAPDGHDALSWLSTATYDALILDLMLPDIDGLDICRTIRRQGIQTPILMLTARDTIADRVTGLDAGADDYLVKPFALAELHARLRALARRPANAVDVILHIGNLTLDPASRRVWRDSSEIELRNKEFSILEHLMRHPDQVLTRSMIADQVWGYDFPSVTNVIDVHIGSLRRKLHDPYPGKLIQTVRGAGYRLSSRP
jgi:DNA-binding response OmpR family regulator